MEKAYLLDADVLQIAFFALAHGHKYSWHVLRVVEAWRTYWERQLYLEIRKDIKKSIAVEKLWGFDE